jgi:hypothetical protein
MVDHDFSSDSLELSNRKEVTLWALLKRAKFTFAAMSSALCYFCYTFMEPILAQRLTDFKLDPLHIGLFFAIYPLFYIPSSIAIQFMPRYIEKRVTLITAALLTGVAFCFVGPSDMLGMPDILSVMGLGQAIAGITTAFLLIPGLPEMIESSIPAFPGQENKVNDLSAGIFNSFLGFGQVLAPAYGSLMVEQVGFRITCDVVSILCIAFSLSYFIMGDGYEAFSTTVKNFKASRETGHSDDEYKTLGKDLNTSRISYASSYHSSKIITTPAYNGLRA